jgi:hypothetical protein
MQTDESAVEKTQERLIVLFCPTMSMEKTAEKFNAQKISLTKRKF